MSTAFRLAIFAIVALLQAWPEALSRQYSPCDVGDGAIGRHVNEAASSLRVERLETAATGGLQCLAWPVDNLTD